MNLIRSLLFVGSSLLLLASPCFGRPSPLQEPDDEKFEPKMVINKKFPSIRNVAIRNMKTADKLLEDNELVLGVVINKHPRAYAINMLTGPTREIINDDLGGESIAATW